MPSKGKRVAYSTNYPDFKTICGSLRAKNLLPIRNLISLNLELISFSHDRKVTYRRMQQAKI
jgi:hypothetical protein